MSASPKRRLPVIAQAVPETDAQPDWKWSLLGVVFFYALWGSCVVAALAIWSPDSVWMAGLAAVPACAWASTKLLLGPADAKPRAAWWAAGLSVVLPSALMLSVDPRGLGPTWFLFIAPLLALGTWLGTRKNVRV